MKKAVFIFIFLMLLVFTALYFIRSNERVNNIESTVFVKETDGKYELIRNGEPFFIQGASGNSYLEELKKSGANTFRVYDTVNIKAVLDEAQKLDLAVIVDLMLPRFKGNEEYYKDDDVRSELKTNIINVVEKNKNHPALLMWNFNEIEYPHQLKYKYFRKFFGSLVDEMHKVDSNHPVSTSITGSNKKQIASLKVWCPQLDLISINVFGGLTYLKYEFYQISLIWNGPFYLSEWGINGPWEESRKTNWEAPIETTSTQKSKELKIRYGYMPSKEDKRCVGNLVFFWGHKQERTHTWFSLFSEFGDKSKSINVLSEIWGNRHIGNKAPELYSLKLNEKLPIDNVIINSGEKVSLKIDYNDIDSDSISIKYELYPENWAYFFGSKEIKPQKHVANFTKISENVVEFEAPSEEGPYRVFSYIFDNDGNFATANVPFYVLESEK